MSEIDTLHALEARLGILARPGTEQELLDHAAAFTRIAAAELAQTDTNWGNVRKTSGTRVRDLDVDKVLHRHTLQMVDIVIGAGANGQHVGWQHVATGTLAQWVAPEASEPPIVEPSPADVLETLEEIRAALDSIDTQTQALLDEQRVTNDFLRRASVHFGL